MEKYVIIKLNIYRMMLRSNRQNMFTMYKKYIYVFCDFWQKLRCSWDYVHYPANSDMDVGIDANSHGWLILHRWRTLSIDIT